MTDRYMLRLPDGLRDRIKAVATENNRSMNSEIIDRLEETFVQDEVAGHSTGYSVMAKRLTASMKILNTKDEEIPLDREESEALKSAVRQTLRELDQIKKTIFEIKQLADTKSQFLTPGTTPRTPSN